VFIEFDCRGQELAKSGLSLMDCVKTDTRRNGDRTWGVRVNVRTLLRYLGKAGKVYTECGKGGYENEGIY